MANVLRSGLYYVARTVSQKSLIRSITVTASRPLKEIQVKNEGASVVIEGVNVLSPRSALMVRPPELPAPVDPAKPAPCHLCALGLEVKHTDVLILSQYVRSDGCVLPRRITGLCSRQQKKISKMVAMAQKAGLMINLTPENCKKDPKKRFGFKKFNTYFDEATIFAPKPARWADRFKR